MACIISCVGCGARDARGDIRVGECAMGAENARQEDE